jgi:hypothetical protein
MGVYVVVVVVCVCVCVSVCVCVCARARVRERVRYKYMHACMHAYLPMLQTSDPISLSSLFALSFHIRRFSPFFLISLQL